MHPETPPASPAPLKGGKKKKKSQGAKLPKKFPGGGKSAEQGAQSLKGDVYVPVGSFFFSKERPLLSRPNSTKVTSHVPGANSTPTPSTSGVGITI